MFYTINSSPLLFTEYVFMLIYILINYKTCTDSAFKSSLAWCCIVLCAVGYTEWKLMARKYFAQCSCHPSFSPLKHMTLQKGLAFLSGNISKITKGASVFRGNIKIWDIAENMEQLYYSRRKNIPQLNSTIW